ncbi:MAG: discoidin domain-containing protein [Clostridia bacterium]|nr:discoidin domain-containing protein [Clostridia bacterium]
MKKSRVLVSLILCMALIVGLVPQTMATDNFNVTASSYGITDGERLAYSVKLKNVGDEDGVVVIREVVYDKDGMKISSESEDVELEAAMEQYITKTNTVLYDEANGQYAVVYFWKKTNLEPVCDPVSSLTCSEGSLEEMQIEITTSDVFASLESESDHTADCVADGDLDTYWSAKGVTETTPHSVAAVFDTIYNVTKVGIAFGKGDERSYEFSVETSLDGQTYEPVLEKTWSEKTLDVQYYEVALTRAQYVKFTIYTKDTSDSDNWVQVSEIEAYGSEAAVAESEVVQTFDFEDDELDWTIRAMTEETYTDYTPTLGSELYADIAYLPASAGLGVVNGALHVYDNVDRTGQTTLVSSITASQTPESSNVASNVIDGDLDTKWTASSVTDDSPATLTIEMTEQRSISDISIAFGGSSRTYVFSLALSTDGTNYTTVLDKVTYSNSTALKTYSFTETAMQYALFTFYARTDDSNNGWIQVTEIEIFDGEVEGAGGLLAGTQYDTNDDRGKYNITFDMYLPSSSSSYSWSGFSLTDEMVTGGADLSHYAALQVRFSGDGDGVVLKTLSSNQFNEGSLDDFMSTTFKTDTLINFSLDVDPTARSIEMTVDDGTNSETAFIYFNYNDDERTRPSAWSGLEAKWLVFNSGAGAKCEYYVNNVIITHYPEGETTEYVSKLGTLNPTEDNVEFALLSDTQEDYEGSLGASLYGEVLEEAPAESGIEGSAIHLYDAVGRETNSTEGAGGVSAYIDLPYPDRNTAYKIEFTMYAPTADDYGGFSIGSGRNYTVGSDENPLALQMRFKSNSDGIQFNTYADSALNSGTFSALVGSYTAIQVGNPWKITIEVNPHIMEFTVSIDDGVNVQTNKTKKYCGDTSTWINGVKLDTLMINTGIGGCGDIYVGDITLTDLGKTGVEPVSAVNGILRLEAENGTGKYMHHNGSTTVNFAEKQTPNYTRFVERSGLMDSDGVSFEVMNRPGYFLTIVPGTDTIQVAKYEDTARFKANSTFYKESADNSTYSYATYRDPNKFIYDNSGTIAVWSMHSRSRTRFTVKSEASTKLSDNFKGTSLNTSKWRANYPWDSGSLGHHNHLGIARSSNVVVSDGICLLNTTQISSSDWSAVDEDGNSWADLSSYSFTSGKYAGYVGVISSNWGTVYYKNSYFEGSFKQPNVGSGYWNAFWLNASSGWPPEIDIFEYCSSWGSYKTYTNIHKSSSSSSGTYISAGSSIRTNYHTYALDWGDGYMDFYLDGSHYFRATGSVVTAQSNSSVYLIINGGIGGWEGSTPSTYNTGLRIDWVRTFQY